MTSYQKSFCTWRDHLAADEVPVDVDGHYTHCADNHPAPSRDTVIFIHDTPSFYSLVSFCHEDSVGIQEDINLIDF